MQARTRMWQDLPMRTAPDRASNGARRSVVVVAATSGSRRRRAVGHDRRRCAAVLVANENEAHQHGADDEDQELEHELLENGAVGALRVEEVACELRDGDEQVDAASVREEEALCVLPRVHGVGDDCANDGGAAADKVCQSRQVPPHLAVQDENHHVGKLLRDLVGDGHADELPCEASPADPEGNADDKPVREVVEEVAEQHRAHDAEGRQGAGLRVLLLVAGHVLRTSLGLHLDDLGDTSDQVAREPARQDAAAPGPGLVDLRLPDSRQVQALGEEQEDGGREDHPRREGADDAQALLQASLEAAGQPGRDEEDADERGHHREDGSHDDAEPVALSGRGRRSRRRRWGQGRRASRHRRLGTRLDVRAAGILEVVELLLELDGQVLRVEGDRPWRGNLEVVVAGPGVRVEDEVVGVSDGEDGPGVCVGEAGPLRLGIALGVEKPPRRAVRRRDQDQLHAGVGV
mmetsp:Transcript_97299/g.218068  ORF Transcript_97299/g.218068 Transcript_97299/m.218068 type:complete len:463 (-) Transcript_97299:571-1959(-)